MARSTKRPAESAISDTQRRLAEEAARNKAEEARLQRMLESAPKKREELARKQRDELLKRKGKIVHIDAPASHRFDLAVPYTAKPRRKRKERTFSQVIFVLLVIAFCLSLYYAFRVMGR